MNYDQSFSVSLFAGLKDALESSKDETRVTATLSYDNCACNPVLSKDKAITLNVRMEECAHLFRLLQRQSNRRSRRTENFIFTLLS